MHGCYFVMERYYYIFLLLASVAIPLIRSFEHRIHFRGKWPALFSGVFIMMLVFIPWDVIFTENGVWAFNHRYVMGLYVFGLPLEEWLFFIIIPYCIVFTYEVFRYFLPKLHFPKTALTISVVLGVFFLIMALQHTDKVYTFVVMNLVAALALAQPFLKSHKTWLSHFYFTYAVMLIPFLLVNGALTGMFTPEPVVSYDDMQNLAIRIITIPVEDAVYLLGMMFIVQMIYEGRRKKVVSSRQ